MKRKSKPEPAPLAEPSEQRTSPAALPPKPPPPTFFDQLRQLPEQAWDDHKVYVYRRWPRTSAWDTPRYIDIVRGPVDEEWILEHHGSGRYGLRLNSGRGTIANHICEVMDQARPPRISAEEVMDCPENAKYFHLWPQPEDKEPLPDASAAAVKEMGRLAREAQRRPTVDSDLADLYLKTAEKRDELVKALAEGRPDTKDQLALVESVLNIVDRLQKDRGPAPAPVDSFAIAERVFKLQRELRGDGAGADPLQQFEQTIGLFERIRDLFGAEEAPEIPAGPAVNPWAEFLRGLGPGVGQMLAPLGALLAQWLLTKLPPSPAAPTAPPSARPPAAIIAPRQTPAPQPAASTGPSPAATAPASKADGKEATEQPAPTAPGAPSEALGLIHMLVSPGVQGYNGKQIADSLRVIHPEIYERVRALGVEGIMELLRSEPTLWAQIAVLEPEIRSLAQQFMDYQSQDEDAAPAATAQAAPPS